MGKETDDAFFIAFGTVAFSLNVIEMIMILKKRKSWKPFDKLLLSLSVADILVATTTITFNLMKVAGHTSFKKESSFMFLLIVSGDFSVAHIFAITVDRFWAVKRPLHHCLRMQGKLPSLIIVLVWATSTTLAMLFLVILFQARTFVLALMKFFSAILIILGVCYGIAYRYMLDMVLKQSAKARNMKACPIKDVIRKGRQCKNERNMLITCSLVVISYIICMYPICIEVLVVKDVKKISSVTQAFLLANSICNPLVYFYKGLNERRMRNGSTTSNSKTPNADLKIKENIHKQETVVVDHK